MTILIIAGLLIFAVFSLSAFFGAPYVPTLPRYVQVALNDLYRIKPSDVLVDIGSGDGVILRYAAQRGARAIGYEINPFLVILSKIISFRQSNIKTKFTNFWRDHLPNDTTIVYVFTVSRDAKKIAKYLQAESIRMNHGFYVISFGFELAEIKKVKNVGAYHLYRVEALHHSKAQV